MEHHEITGIRHLTDHTFVIRFDRKGLAFRAGQHLLAGLENQNKFREYSIYSGENDPFLEILIREVAEGQVSPSLKSLQPGHHLIIDGPMGVFNLNPKTIQTDKICFVATGTGIAPFHSMVRSYPDLDYLMIHGVKYENEQYENPDYESKRYISCVSRDKSGKFHGRVTDYLKTNFPGDTMKYYLCGNFSMIREVFDILSEKGIPRTQIHTEVYF